MRKAAYPMLAFKTPKEWETWLKKHHNSAAGLRLQLFKKDSGKVNMTYQEALDVALCYGWIDGMKRSHDDASWIQVFTPRRPRSVWSKTNRENIARLTKVGRMRAAGQKQVEAAKADGRWDNAYDPASSMTIPADFLKELKKDKKAFAFFQTLKKANTYAIAWRLQTAKKPETRERRLQVLLEMMKQGKKLH